MTADLRLSGGEVLVAGGATVTADLLISSGRIAGVLEPNTSAEAVQNVSIAGLTVLPGVVDAHVHLGQDITVPKTADDVELETAAAAAGGVTTLIAYLMVAVPYDEVFEDAVALLERHARTDVGLHFCIVTRDQLEQLPHYARDLGVSSFKLFMNFRGDEGAYLGLPGNDDGFLYDLLAASAACGGLVNPHGENVEIIWRLREQPIPPGLSDLETWNHLRPAFVEAEAQQRAAFFASVAGASLYAVHVTNAAALNALERQRAAYEHVFLETCPHYLTHDETCGLGTIAKVNPPLRTASDREVLWEAIAAGRIDVVGSDHVPRHGAAKVPDILKASAGFPGLETLLPVLLSEGHAKRGIPLARIAEVASLTPAKIYGLYPRKGEIAVGADADLAIVDLDATYTIEASTLHSGAGFSIYDGWEMTGKVVHTLLRGQFTLRDSSVVGSPAGRFVPRRRSGATALEAAR